MKFAALLLGCVFSLLLGEGRPQNLPLIVTTWPSGEAATNRAWEVLSEGGSGLDAVERGISDTCELSCCMGSVGACGRIDEDGDVSLDAMVMHGPTHAVGSVGGIRNIRNPISVARAVMEFTGHTLLVGSQATAFAVEMGFTFEDLRTPESNASQENWIENDCQPNSWENVTPDPDTSCGPYSPGNVTSAQSRPKTAHQRPRTALSRPRTAHQRPRPAHQRPITAHQLKRSIHPRHKSALSEPRGMRPVVPGAGTGKRRGDTEGDPPPHSDTICQIVVDNNTDIVAGTSTNGFNHKIMGRVGDTPITGAGAYVDNDVGAAVATGNGDIMMRFLPTFLTVEMMRAGLDPSAAAREAIARITPFYPTFDGSILVANKDGQYGAACNPANRESFSFALREAGMEAAEIVTIDCAESMRRRPGKA